MTGEEAAEILGPQVVADIHAMVESWAPPTDAEVAVVVRTLLSAERARAAEPEGPDQTGAA